MKPARFETITALVLAALVLNSCDNNPVARQIQQVVVKKKPIVIGIQPYLGFNRALTDTLATTVQEAFGLHVVVMSAKDLPSQAFTNVKAPRYRADSLILFLKEDKPDSIDYIIGLTHWDICITKRDKSGRILEPVYKYTDFGIFGLGYRPGSSCVVSSERLSKNVDQSRFHSRIKKVVVHELGHNLGLDHCSNDRYCVMNDAAETVKTVDRINRVFCAECKELIRSKVEL